MENQINKKTREFISSREGCVFLIDDNPIYLSILEEEVQRLLPNATVFLFESGEKAMEKIELDPFLVFLDYDLAGTTNEAMNGINVLKRMKKNNPEVEVVMLSGVDDINIITTCMKYGAFDFIFKNEKAMSDVRHKITAILRKLRMAEERIEDYHAKWFLKWVAILLTITASLGIYFYEDIN